MQCFPLNATEVSAFELALENDDGPDLVKVLVNAIRAKNWPANSRLSLRVNKQDPVWRVASLGQPGCFRSIVEFVFDTAGWDTFPKILCEGRVARFSVDVCQYIQQRVEKGIPVSRIAGELTLCFVAFFLTQPDDKLETAATQLTRQINQDLLPLVESIKRSATQQRFARVEAEALFEALAKSTSEALGASKKLRL